jgi:hypothetical protein
MLINFKLNFFKVKCLQVFKYNEQYLLLLVVKTLSFAIILLTCYFFV